MTSVRPLTAALAAVGLVLGAHAGAQNYSAGGAYPARTPDQDTRQDVTRSRPDNPVLTDRPRMMDRQHMMDRPRMMDPQGMTDHPRMADQPRTLAREHPPVAQHQPMPDRQDGLVEREMGVLPPERRQGSVAFVTGGVGDPEDQAFRAARSRYPLAVEFTGRGQPGAAYGQHLANVEVTIVDQGGREVLRTVADGPWLLARVPTGRYTVHARFEGRELTRQAIVAGSGHRTVVFTWDNVG